MSTPVERLMSKLPNAKRYGNTWTARCPAHDDENPSLSIAEGEDGRALVHCHAGCPPDAICLAIGLHVADLMPPTSATKRTNMAMNGEKPTVDSGKTNHGAVVALYEYYDERGNVRWRKVRYADKFMHWEHLDGQKLWKSGYGSGKPTLYRLPGITSGDHGDSICLCEGEKDADSLAELGYIATSLPSTGAWKNEYAEYLRDRDVILLEDNDGPGRKAVAKLADALVQIARTIRIVRFAEFDSDSTGAGYDVTDYLGEYSPASLAELMEAAVPATLEASSPPATPTTNAIDKTIAEFRPFPAKALPQPAQRFVEVVSSALGCEPSYVAVPLLVALAAAIGNRRVVRLKNSWTEPSVLWGAIVGESGTLKSPALEKATAPLMRVEHAARRSWEAEHEEYATRKTLFNADFDQ